MDHYTCCRLASWRLEEITKALGVPIEKALNPLNPLDFVTITVRLARALKGATAGEEAKALKEGIQTLDVDWPNLSAAQRKEIIAAARAEVANTATAEERAEKVLAGSTTKIVPWTRAASVKKFGLSIGKDVTDIDKDTAKRLKESQMVYIKTEYDTRADVFDEMAKSIVAGGLESGADRDTISERLATNLAEYNVNRSKNYWNLIATDFSNKARTSTQLNAFSEAKIKRYRYEAVMDEATSSVCRLLNGKVFSVSTALETINTSLDDPEDVKLTAPWVQSGIVDGKESLYYNDKKGNRVVVAHVRSSGVGNKDDAGDFDQKMSDKSLEAAGVTVPPRHSHCRSTIIAE